MLYSVASEPEQSEEDTLADHVTGHASAGSAIDDDDDDHYMLTSTVTYETPITQVEYLAESEVDSMRMKTERGAAANLCLEVAAAAGSSHQQEEASNINELEDFDDYEMQERLSNNDCHIKSFNEDPNDSSS
jgi:hypothetical protein